MLEAWEAVVFDLDETLVQLAVDWDRVAEDAADALADAGGDPTDADLWELLERAERAGVRDELESVIAAHELAGAREATRLALADDLPEIAAPVGVCSLNCESACRIALAVHDLDSYVDAVVGRDTVGSWKPEPESLLAAIDELGVAPAETIFIGDSERDAITAERAGTAFAYDHEALSWGEREPAGVN